MVPRLLRQVGLETRVAQMYPHELSGGMKQRVLMAICVALEPRPDHRRRADHGAGRDDPAGDPAEPGRPPGEFGVTLVVISHDMGVHAQLVDRVAVMHDGRIVEVGDVHQVFDSPKDDYTRGLIASIPRMELPDSTELSGGSVR